jgi:hypothetical protein
MNLNESHKLKILMKENPDLFAVNNLRDHKNPGQWRVDANMRANGEVIRMRSLAEYQDWLIEQAVPEGEKK